MSGGRWERPKLQELFKHIRNATQVVDRFTHSFFTFFKGIRDKLRLVHVQKLATEALQDIRIQYRWEAIELENTLLTVSRVAKNFGLEKQQLISGYSFM